MKLAISLLIYGCCHKCARNCKEIPRLPYRFTDLSCFILFLRKSKIKIGYKTAKESVKYTTCLTLYTDTHKTAYLISSKLVRQSPCPFQSIKIRQVDMINVYIW